MHLLTSVLQNLCYCSDQGVLRAAWRGQQAGAGRHSPGEEEWREAGFPCLNAMLACRLSCWGHAQLAFVSFLGFGGWVVSVCPGGECPLTTKCRNTATPCLLFWAVLKLAGKHCCSSSCCVLPGREVSAVLCCGWPNIVCWGVDLQLCMCCSYL